MNFGLILFSGAFNSRRRLNDVGLNLVEVRATKGGEVAAFRRFFRLWAFLTRWAVDWREEGRKGARGA